MAEEANNFDDYFSIVNSVDSTGSKERPSSTDENSCENKIESSDYVIKVSPLSVTGYPLPPRNDLVTLIYQQQQVRIITFPLCSVFVLFIYSILFLFNQTEKNCISERRKYTYKCVYWQVEKNDWDDFGCTHQLFTYAKGDQRPPKHICYCNHTTNFALIMVNNFRVVYRCVKSRSNY